MTSERRDPRKDPQPGDLLVQDALFRRVLSLEDGRVTWDWPHFPERGPSTSTLGAWRAWAKRATTRSSLGPLRPGVAPPPLPASQARDGATPNGATNPADPAEGGHREQASPATQADEAPDTSRRDLKPANVLSERDACALLTVYDLRDGSGWARVARRQDLLDRSGLVLSAWQRAVASLERAGLLVVEVVPARESRPSGYQLAGQALEVAASLLAAGDPRLGRVGRGGSAPGSGAGSRTDLPPKHPASKKKNNEVPDPPTRPSPLADPTQPADLAAVLARALDVLDGHARALAALVERLGPASAPAPPPEVRPGTCERCGAPEVVRQGKFGPFAACPHYPRCKPGRKRQSDEERLALERARSRRSDDPATIAERRGLAPVGDDARALAARLRA